MRSSPATSARPSSGQRAILTMNSRSAAASSDPSPTASMANAMPQAIGAQPRVSRSPSCSRFAGDGGLSMLLGDLLTIRQQQASVKIVVYDNGAYAFVEVEMKAAGLVEFGTQLGPNPSFADLARRCRDCRRVRVEDPAELPGRPGRGVRPRRPGPARRCRQPPRASDPSYPPGRTGQRLHPLYMLKAVFERSGRRAHRPREDEPLALS